MKIQIQRNKQVAASATITPLCGGHFEIEYMLVAKEFRGQKLGSELLKWCINWANKFDATLIAFIELDGTGLNREQEIVWLERYDFGGYTKPVHIFNLK